jgi:photosynthetic reaction center H subunit
MQIGAITGYIDVAQVVLYVFWLFFAGVIFYLRTEDKREGYPLVSDRSPSVRVEGFPPIPKPKTFILGHGMTRQAPRFEAPEPTPLAQPTAGFQGAAWSPIGDPLSSGAGPAASALRADVPEHFFESDVAIIVPLRADPKFSLETGGPDPRGWPVIAADGVSPGTIRDVWVDRAEVIVRYLEIDLGTRFILAPMVLITIDAGRRRVLIDSLLAAQFAGAPGLSIPDRVTLREEDQITAYFGAGSLYAEPSRLGPLL